MKLKSIKILGMHKVVSRVYDLHDVTYFVGPNGAGKSTILQAIQLALLGYIPGYGKTNAEIMKHSSGNALSVEAVLVDETGTEASIIRTWTRSGASIKNSTMIIPTTLNLEALLKDVELPVYNFNEFRNMTANKLKEWFISFLPSANSSLDWSKMLQDSLGSRLPLLNSSFLESTIENINEFEETGLDLVKKVNEYFKNQLSFDKSQLTRLQGTIDSLIYYDDTEVVDESDIQDELASLDEQKILCIKYEDSIKAFEDYQARLKMIQAPANSLEEDAAYKEALETKAFLESQIAALSSKESELAPQLQELKVKYASETAIKSSVCPYTHVECNEIASKLKSLQESAEITLQKIKAVESDLHAANLSRKESESRLRDTTSTILQIQNEYKLKESLLAQMPPVPVAPLNPMSVEEIASRIKELQDKLVRIRANNSYEELNSKVTADKMAVENEIEVLKIWINYTGANGLQTSLMQAPFEEMAADMSKYLTQMFGAVTSAKFNLEEKANSFSFGLTRDDAYIEFDLLSSGEKCLYTLALVLCVLERSSSELKLVLADDILDHLDAENASHLFDLLVSKLPVQFVLAGVANCENTSICYNV